MKKPPGFLKALSLVGLIIAIIGIIMAFKVPGNISSVPLFIALVLGVVVLIATLKNKYKCYGGYIIGVFVIFGLIVMLIQQSKTPEIAVDEEQQEQLEETNDEVVDELDDMLDELE